MERFRHLSKKAMSICMLIISEFAWILIDFMILMAFLSLTLSTVKAFHGRNLTREIVMAYVGGIAICFSLASVLFSYAKICPENEKHKIVSCGKSILNGGILLLISFMLNYYQISVGGNFSLPFYQQVFSYTSGFALVGCIGFAAIAGLELHRGFKSLMGSIFY